MLESGLSGSVRGVPSNGHPYRDPGSQAAAPTLRAGVVRQAFRRWAAMSREEAHHGSPQARGDAVRVVKADKFIAATNAHIRLGGDCACYIPSLDFITLPPESAFKSREHFLATSLHECGHWTGAKSRLDRDLRSRFNEKAYAAEELIAELTAAFLCAHLGITGELRHAEYIATWISLLEEDDRAIFTAASKASQAANFLRAFSGEVQESE
jgi:antirestriction protein ArdC